MNMMIASVWIAAFLLGVAVGILGAAFIPGWSRPYRLTTVKPLVDDMLAADSHLDNQRSTATERKYDENAMLYQNALQGHRHALDQLGVRAGRVTLNTQPNLFAWDEKGPRDHAWLLYDQIVNNARVAHVLGLGNHPNETQPPQEQFKKVRVIATLPDGTPIGSWTTDDAGNHEQA